MKTQVDIPKEIHKKLKMYKVENELVTLPEAIIKILEEKWKIKKL